MRQTRKIKSKRQNGKNNLLTFQNILKNVNYFYSLMFLNTAFKSQLFNDLNLILTFIMKTTALLLPKLKGTLSGNLRWNKIQTKFRKNRSDNYKMFMCKTDKHINHGKLISFLPFHKKKRNTLEGPSIYVLPIG
jgi:hypothetical protein